MSVLKLVGGHTFSSENTVLGDVHVLLDFCRKPAHGFLKRRPVATAPVACAHRLQRLCGRCFCNLRGEGQR